MFALTAVFVLTAVVSTVNAYMVSNRTLNGSSNWTTFITENVGNDFHTTIYPTYKNEPTISVENSIRRKESGSWVEKSNKVFYISTLNECYHYDLNLSGVQATRAYWRNRDLGTRVIADLYIDPDHMN